MKKNTKCKTQLTRKQLIECQKLKGELLKNKHKMEDLQDDNLRIIHNIYRICFGIPSIPKLKGVS